MMTVAVAIGGGGGAFLLLFDRFGGLGGIFNVGSHGDCGLFASMQEFFFWGMEFCDLRKMLEKDA